MAEFTTGVVNNYSIKPRNLTQYTAFRGVTDFSQIGQFSQFERGYAFLSVLQMPRFMVELGKQKPETIGPIVDGFKHKIEFEFRGLEGLSDITADYLTISDGINEQRLISKVSEDTSITVSSQYYETQGAILEKFTEIYLTGLHDTKSQAKTYHGLIKAGILAPGPENEVFTLLYYVTDSTMLRLERAFLLVNAQLTTARRSELYNATRSDIGSNVETTVEWNCYPLAGEEVDKIAKVLLQDITGVKWYGNKGIKEAGQFDDSKNASDGQNGNKTAVLDSTGYKYAILREEVITNATDTPSDTFPYQNGSGVEKYSYGKSEATDPLLDAVRKTSDPIYKNPD